MSDATVSMLDEHRMEVASVCAHLRVSGDGRSAVNDSEIRIRFDPYKGPVCRIAFVGIGHDLLGDCVVDLRTTLTLIEGVTITMMFMPGDLRVEPEDDA